MQGLDEVRGLGVHRVESVRDRLLHRRRVLHRRCMLWWVFVLRHRRDVRSEDRRRAEVLFADEPGRRVRRTRVLWRNDVQLSDDRDELQRRVRHVRRRLLVRRDRQLQRRRRVRQRRRRDLVRELSVHVDRL
jgi:hypothetical protein